MFSALSLSLLAKKKTKPGNSVGDLFWDGEFT